MLQNYTDREEVYANAYVTSVTEQGLRLAFFVKLKLMEIIQAC